MSRFLAICTALLFLLLPVMTSAQDVDTGDDLDSLSGGAVAPTSRPAQVEFVIPQDKLEIGLPFTVLVKLKLDGDYSEIRITPDKFWEAYLIQEDLVKTAPTEFTVTLQARKYGTYTFKPEIFALPVGSTEPLRLEPVSFELTIEEPLYPDTPFETKAFLGVRDLPFDYTWRNVIIVTASFLTLAMLVGVCVLLYQWGRRNASRPVPMAVTPPIVEAIAEVRSLAALEMFITRGADAHYTGLSLALRRYLERQYGVPALEMTEDEVIDFLRRNLDTAQHSDALAKIFSRSSLAKFARQPITQDVATEDCETSLGFLHRELERIEAQQAAERARAAQSQGKAA